MARRPSNNDGLRQLIIASRQRFWDRWRIRCEMGEFEAALKSGAAVLLDSSTLGSAFDLAGVPSRDYWYGGRYHGKVFRLDENDRLTEVGVAIDTGSGE
jgi:hypothetical protein